MGHTDPKSSYGFKGNLPLEVGKEFLVNGAEKKSRFKRVAYHFGSRKKLSSDNN